jgi:F0F1-type ATP synthase assembly protein I
MCEEEGVSMPQSEPDYKLLGQLAVLSQIGLEMAAPVGAGALADYFFGWAPWGSICGAVLGLVGGMAHLIAILNRAARESSEKRQRESQ